MKRILITGATGNVGFEVVRCLNKMDCDNKVVAGVRNITGAQKTFVDCPNLEYVHFDFDDPATFEGALSGIDSVFLLRPPHISDVDSCFKPFVMAMKKKMVNEVVFLSVQGAEKSKVIPHNKIERLIKESGIKYVFLRPSYFMQNLTTTLIGDIVKHRSIVLPSGRAKFNWIDILNIGEVAAIVLNKFEDHKNQTYEITGLENESFDKVTSLINSVIKNPISYKSVNPLQFYSIKRKEGMVQGMIFVMLLLHFLPRFQKEPEISFVYEQLTGKQPTDLRAFIEREKEKFEQ
jgi:uncharacterized protein YbjT (DUF2867 family)